MNYITGQDRHQIGFGSLADEIGSDNPVRFIDAFVDKIDLFQLGLILVLGSTSLTLHADRQKHRQSPAGESVSQGNESDLKKN